MYVYINVHIDTYVYRFIYIYSYECLYIDVGLQCSVLQLLGTGYFHSDPHRGNLLQSPSGDLVYLDFGMMSEVPADQRYGIHVHIDKHAFRSIHLHK